MFHIIHLFIFHDLIKYLLLRQVVLGGLQLQVGQGDPGNQRLVKHHLKFRCHKTVQNSC